MVGTYLDLDKLLDAVGDEDDLVALGGLADESLVAGADPATVLVVNKGLGVGLFVVQVAEDDRGGLQEQLAALVVAVNDVALGVNQLGLVAGQQVAGGAGDEIDLAAGGGDGRRFRHALNVVSTCALLEVKQAKWARLINSPKVKVERGIIP